MSGELPDVASDTAESARLFAQHRSAVIGAAYRLLGSLSDAEDVAQETWLRWAEVPLREVTNPRAYLVRIGTRLALNRLRQLSRQRESYIGPWLPEPVDDLSRVGGTLDRNAASVRQLVHRGAGPAAGVGSSKSGRLRHPSTRDRAVSSCYPGRIHR